ncbi:MAG: hypothetical protein LIO59_00325 [Oscillospiraceae bacterium]|nr:hypothetical protein [Clostridiales bacterium]MCC8168834.1 hypothetical protein [Oscillospiraceae bacterium]
MTFKRKYIGFSKALVFALCGAFFIVLAFDAYVILRLLNFMESGGSLTYATVIGTITSVMSTFSNAVILFAVKHYLQKSETENAAGYDAKTQTTSAERIKMAELKGMGDDNDFGGEDV